MRNFTYAHRVTFLCILGSLLTLKSFSQQLENYLILPTGERVGFLEYKPANYNNEGSIKHPVIIFLHGIGERGNGTTDLKYVARIGLPRMIKLGHNMEFSWNGKKETFLVLSPQCPKKYSMWPELIVNEMIRYAKEKLRVDENRIYITGLSMGGGGTYRYISRQQRQAETVAAAATICAPCTFQGDGGNIARAKLPLWSFHAANDSVALAYCTEFAIRKVNEANPVVKPLKTIWPDGGHNVWDRVYTDTSYRYNGVINIYEWFLGQNRSWAPNVLPVAKAGNDIRITVSQASVKLDGSASYDRDGKLVRYVWKKISGPSNVSIKQKMGTASITTVTGLTQAGEYLFELAVVDNRASYTRDTLKIIVSNEIKDTTKTSAPVEKPVPAPAPVPADTAKKPAPAPAPPPMDTLKKPVPAPADTVKKSVPANKPPVARTTQDRVIPIEWNYFPVVSGWPSTDEDGWIARFKWEKVSGPDTFNIVSPNTCATRVNNLVPGAYVFRVTAFDNKGASSYADVKITMTIKGKVPDHSTKSSKPVNKPPVARTTQDREIPVEWNYFPVISGWPSTDEDGWIARFKWEKISGPDSFNIVSPNTCATRVNNLVRGVYIFRVTAYDNKGASSYADVKITMTTREDRKRSAAMVTNNSVVETGGEQVSAIPLTQVNIPSSFKLYPNPATSIVNLEYTSRDNGKSLITINDASGRFIKAIPFTKNGPIYRHNLDISKLPDGLYYVEIRTGNQLGLSATMLKR